MVQHEMQHKRMRAQTIFSTTAKTGELQPEIKDKLRQWIRDHKEYENSPTLDPKAVCERAGKNLICSISIFRGMPIHRSNRSIVLRTAGRQRGTRY